MRAWQAEPARSSELRPLSGPGAPVTALLRADAADVRRATGARLVLANPDGQRAASVRMEALLAGAAGFARFRPLAAGDGRGAGAGQRGAARTRRGAALRGRGAAPGAAPGRGAEAASRRRAAGGGRGRARRARAAHRDRGRGAGRRWRALRGEARGGRDRRGHGRPALRRAREDGRGPPVARGGRDDVAGDAAGAARQRPLDRLASRCSRMGRYVFVVEAWRDAFATFLDELAKKHAAGVPISLELEEGRLLVAAAAERAGGELVAVASRLKNAVEAERLAVLTAPETAALMAQGRRPALPRAQPRDARRGGADRRALRELVRDVPAQPERQHGAARHLPRRHRASCRASAPWASTCSTSRRSTRSARAFRKGRNNTLTPGPDDPGSPYAIGSPEGGHDALHPELGTLRGLPRRCARRRRSTGWNWRSTSPSSAARTIPGCREHKDWFDWRPDGSLRYAENPPKKYQDIVNVDFYKEGAMPSLWLALRDVVRFWCEQGVQAVPRGQPAHQALPVLGVDDRRHPRPLPGRGVPGRGLHPAEDDGPARQDRLLAVLHLLHLAEREAGDRRVPDGADDDGAEGLLPPAFLRQHAGHQPVLPADLRPLGLPDPRRAGDHLVGPLGDVPGLRVCARGGRCRAARSTWTARNTRSASGRTVRTATSSTRSRS